MLSQRYFSDNWPSSRSARKRVSNSATCSPTLKRPVSEMSYLAWKQGKRIQEETWTISFHMPQPFYTYHSVIAE
jgi:hypothetical protein